MRQRRRKRRKNVMIPSILIILIFASLAGIFILKQSDQSSSKAEQIHYMSAHKPRPQQMENREFTEKLTIGAIGDILIHDPVYRDAFNGNEYNFDPMFQKVKSLLEKPDFLTANQESTLGGVALGLSGYPMFNSPQQVADALVHNGVDMVSTANNHSLDRGEKGIVAEAAYLDSIGLPHVGSFVDQQDKDKLRIITKNGIKMAFLAYTYGTNGIPVPQGKDYLVNLIDREAMKSEIKRARKEADVVIMSIHWGIEYKRVPTEDQKDLATFLASEGVDIIFGSHPHVLEPMQWIENPDGRKTFVIYSLGNFISAQYGDYKDMGGLVTVDITKHVSETGNTVELSNPVFYPTYVTSQHYKNFRVVPMEEAGAYGLPNAQAQYKEIQQHMTQWLR